ncbi:multicopper oxidase family protein [Paenibacillus harenae]|uniref:multicopper oxidase family protein n=1 Tax=Paenibacillus harenae TaxID=306543 RepID=UPI00278F604A|nr:multicopper oxidase family protein [Paenibacillus harenae]MDQ0060909.1 FtsP/CotA-like multicopper oxidase with cupredoxin domain [Paenibacillus harenae]
MRKLSRKGKVSLNVLAFIILFGAVIIGTYFWQIRMQKPLEVDMGVMHHGEAGSNHAHGAAIPVTNNGALAMRACNEIIAEASEAPLREFRLTAAQAVKELDNGKSAKVWAFNGLVPGPELRVTEGDRVRIVLNNKDINEGVTVHWHGIVLPCSQDGVAGVSQNAVKPGEQFTYEFEAGHPGTYWYHSHQASSEQVKKGLLGKLIVEPKNDAFDYDEEDSLLIQQLNGTYLMNGSTKDWNIEAAPGSTVRVRVINAANETDTVSVNGAAYRIIAMDGHDLNEPGLLDNYEFRMGAGQRYDLLLQIPQQGKVIVASKKSGLKATLGTGSDPVISSDPSLFSFVDYGKPVSDKSKARLSFDRNYSVTLDQNLFVNTINGKSFHEIPPMMVEEGDHVKITITNAGGGDHPFHLHGHVFRVLSRNGQPLSGSPVYLDTLLTQKGEAFEVHVIADNPGLWMMHCHDLMHASMGMSMMFNYEGVTTPYRVGTKSGNLPDL